MGYKHMIKKRFKKFTEELETIYDLFKWHWVSSSGSPDKEEIKKTILGLLFDLLDNDKSIGIGTGGITVSYEDENLLNIEWRLTKSLYLSKKEVQELLKANSTKKGI